MTGTTLSIHPGREAETEHIWRDVGTFQKKAHSSYFSFPAAETLAPRVRRTRWSLGVTSHREMSKGSEIWVCTLVSSFPGLVTAPSLQSVLCKMGLAMIHLERVRGKDVPAAGPGTDKSLDRRQTILIHIFRSLTLPSPQ